MLVVLTMLLAGETTWGQLSITSTGTAFTQNFNGMGSSATATTPTGFKIGTDWNTGTSATTQAAGTTGAGVLTGSSSGGTYNFANGVTASSTDRALGFLNSGSFTSPQSIVLRINNNTGVTLSTLSIAFDYEKYRSGSRAFDWTFFHGSTATPGTAAAAGNQSYAADANNTVIFDPPTATNKTVNLTGLSIANGGSYYLKWTFTGVGGSTNGQAIGIDNFSVSACPTISFTGTPTNTCPAANNGQIAVSGVSGGTSPYTYSKDNGVNYQSGATFTGLAANTYQVVVKDANGCTSGPIAVVVGTFTPPGCSVSGADYVCNNSMGNVYNAPGGMSAYSWSISGNGSIPGSTAGQSVSVTAGAYLNTYTVSVTVTDANGCTSNCSKQSFIYLFTPPANITVNPNPVCTGAILDLSITAAASSTVSWTGEGITNPSGNPSTTAIPTTTGPHTYSVLVTADNGCSNTGTASVTVNATPTPTITGPVSVCSGGSAMLDAGAGYSAYAWSNGGGSGQTATYTNITTPTTYTVTVTSANGCTGTDTHAVNVNSPPGCSITFLNPPPFYFDTTCANLAGNMYSAPAGMSAYNWSILGQGTITSATNGASLTVTAGASSGYYLYLTVTDGNGCTSTCQKTTPIKPSPTCSVSGPSTVCGNSTGNVHSVTTDGSSYSWGISGDGVITSATNGTSVTVTAGASGTYTVSVTTTWFNACSSTCSQTVTVNSAPAPVITGPTLVCNGGSAMLDAGAGYSTYAWSNGGGSGQTATFTNITTTTTYTVTVTAANGCTGTDTHTVTAQSCSIDFSGKIVWENDDVTGVKDATVKLTGSSTMTALTDVNGDFLIATGLTSGSFTLKPTKNINKFNGVNAGDVTAIQQHVTFVNVITDPYKLVCADVNKSNSVNTLDGSLITQALLGNPAANAQFNTSWRFVPTSHMMVNPPWGFPEQRTYTAITTSQTNQNFVGMKIGDVTGDANPANFGSAPSLVLRASDQILKSGETIDLRFSADQLNDLAAFQFGLTFDPAALQFVDVQTPAGLPITADNFGLYKIFEGEIRAVWAQATGITISEASPIFQLRFTVLQSGAKLSDVLQLNDAVLPARAFTGQLVESGVELRYSATSGTLDPTANLLELNVQPNPFREETTVSFALPEACEAQLRVFDVNGRELLRINKTYPAGKNSETLRLEGPFAAGLLTCELVTPFGAATRRIVKAN